MVVAQESAGSSPVSHPKVMKNSFVLLAINNRRVTVAKEVLVNVEPTDFQAAFDKFQKLNPGCAIMFFNEDEIASYLKEINRKKSGI